MYTCVQLLQATLECPHIESKSNSPNRSGCAAVRKSYTNFKCDILIKLQHTGISSPPWQEVIVVQYINNMVYIIPYTLTYILVSNTITTKIVSICI